jgi:type I restriction enzyme, S subunit
MPEWPTAPLASLVSDSTPITYGIVKPAENDPNGVLLVRGGDIKNGRIDLGALRRVPRALSEQYRRTILRGGEIVVSLVGDPGQVAIVPQALAGANVNRAVGLVRPRADVNIKFIAYYLRSTSGQRQLTGLSLGSVQQVVNLADLKRVAIPRPPEFDEKQIVELLSALEERIELNRRTNETLEAMAQAIFRDWFVDFGPVRRKLDGASDPVAVMGGLTPDPDRAAALAALFPDTLADDGLPEGWRWFLLSDVAALSKAQTSPGERPDGLFRHYSLPAFDSGGSPALDRGTAIKSNKFTVPAGMVLLSKLNPEISRVWLPDDGDGPQQVSSTEFLVLQPKHGRSLLYALCRDHAFKARLEAMVTGTSKSHQRVSPPALMAQTVLVGSPPIFAEFERLAEALHGRVLCARAENRTLAETRDYLLPRLMSGEVRVSDIEIDARAVAA